MTANIGTKRRVLLVDDDPLLRKVYQDGLTRHGFEVQTAQDGLNAILLLRTDPPDILVLDLMMPRLSGSDVLKFIQAQPGLKQLLIIVLSNSFLHDGEKPILDAGAQKVLIKLRSTPAVLAAEIEACLKGDPPSPPPTTE